MSRVVVIGGSGHIGAYLAPQLVGGGFEVISVSRGKRAPYQPHAAWKSVRMATLDRDAEEKLGAFGGKIRELRPDIVIDLTCFTEASARHLVEALRGKIRHFLHIGTIWVHGPTVEAPTTEEQPRRPFGEYGVAKAAIEAHLIEIARKESFPATIIHPGHIVGPGWAPLNPAGHFDPRVFTTIARGEELALPNFGLETVHHVHAEDVAELIMRAMARWSVSVGEAFHAVSPAALTLRGYAEAMAFWFGREASLRYLPWPEWKREHSEEEAAQTYDHIAHSPNCSIAKAQRLLGYQPRYGSIAAVCEAVTWLIAEGIVKPGG